LAAVISVAPTIASADAATTGSGSTLVSPFMTAYHGERHRHHRHHHHRHRRHPHGMSAPTGL
jgi:hypothetical protein